ncbi:hypothetical protein B5807_10384 [Epicoccum nigrum]|jgi:hypothetical protein|uniref:Uncharacterized protein n=1 Tax=Epicoccum nigrum TaxID=105696 RepID=A0A1Y2LQP5_EPING|nr:hypothetical protein B5807_10384 [Epicoccum nigrum]
MESDTAIIWLRFQFREFLLKERAPPPPTLSPRERACLSALALHNSQPRFTRSRKVAMLRVLRLEPVHAPEKLLDQMYLTAGEPRRANPCVPCANDPYRTNPGSQPHRNVHIGKANDAATCHILC